VDGAVDGAVRDAVDDAVRGAVSDAVHDAVGGAVHDAVGGAVRDAVDGAVDDAVRVAVGVAVGGAVDGAVRDAVRDAANAKIWWHNWMGGQFWVGWGRFAFYWGVAAATYFRDVLLVSNMPSDLSIVEDEAQSCGYWWPNRDFVMVCERPTRIERDQRGRLHSLAGQAIAWPDGWGLHMVHGVRVPRTVIEAPGSLTTREIEQERNAEVRRVMLSQFGAGRFLLESGAKEIARDEYGILYSKDLPEDEPLVMVRLLNSTPEPDGTLTKAEAERVFGVKLRSRPWWSQVFEVAAEDTRWKEYQIRVPPQMRTAREAVAWINGVDANSYNPQVES